MDEEAAAINLNPGRGQGLDWVTEAMFQTGGLYLFLCLHLSNNDIEKNQSFVSQKLRLTPTAPTTDSQDAESTTTSQGG